MMCEMPLMSIPRPTTSVAISSRILPDRNPARTLSRFGWGRSPCMIVTSGSSFDSLWCNASAPRFVRQKTIACRGRSRYSNRASVGSFRL